MKSQLLAGVALGALALSAVSVPAQAGAGGRFGGFTAGVDLGYVDVRGAINDIGNNYTDSDIEGYQETNGGGGMLLGGRLGYDAHLDSGWLIGGELHIAMVSAEDSTCATNDCVDNTSSDDAALGYNLQALGSLRARVGYVVDPNGLLYGFAGFARAKAVTHTHDNYEYDGATRTFDGYTIGGGGQYAVSSNVDFRVEVAYYDFEELAFTNFQDEDIGVQPEALTLSVGAAFHFN